MTILIWQILVAVVTVVVVFLGCQSWGRGQPRGRERRVVPVRVTQRPRAPYAGRVNPRRQDYWYVAGTRTVVLSTLPLPIRGTIEPAELTPPPLPPAELRFAPPDAALMQRVLDGLRALPVNPTGFQNTGTEKTRPES